MRKLRLPNFVFRGLALVGLVLLLGGVTPFCSASRDAAYGPVQLAQNTNNSEKWCCCGGCCGWAIDCSVVPGCLNC